MKKNVTGAGPQKFDRSRRDALRKLGLAAAAPMIVPSSVLAQKTVKSDTPPPSERLSIGLIGLGTAMNSHLKKLAMNSDVFVHALCDVNLKKTKDFEISVRRAYRKEIAEFGKCLVCQDHREIIARDDIDGVVIATPVHWHAAIALDAIRSGKDVLCQSPMTLTVAEGRLIETAAIRHGAVVQCVAPMRCEDQVVRFCELARNGYLGEIKEVYVAMSYFNEPDALGEEQPPADFNYDRWLGPASDVPYHSARIDGGRTSGWRRHWDYGVRTHGEIGFDRYDVVQWALDKESTGPVEFVPAGLDGAAYPSFIYKDGPQVLLGHPTERDKQIEFVGTNGTMNVSSRGQLNTEPPDIERVKLGANDTRLPVFDTVEHSWIDAMKTRGRPLVNASVAHRSSSICHLAAIADRSQRRIKWNPKSEEIVDDPIAARMLARPRRAPYTLT